MLKKIMTALFIASLLVTAGVASRRAMAGDNGNAFGHCKGKAQGTAVGHDDCNNACTDLCGVALAGATYSCNASFDPSVCDPADTACIANMEALLSQCLSDANAAYDACLDSCH
jgi:hypothetical protein